VSRAAIRFGEAGAFCGYRSRKIARRQFNRTNVKRPCGGAFLYSTRRGRAFPEPDLGRWVSFRTGTTRPLRNQHEERSPEPSDEMDKTARRGPGPLVSRWFHRLPARQP
jgi:hypothetical protein